MPHSMSALSLFLRLLLLIGGSSLNVFRIYRALERHLSLHPEDHARFPNFDPGNPAKQPILIRGSNGPLEGELHSAEYFHGR
jgi:hypothetical protein